MQIENQSGEVENFFSEQQLSFFLKLFSNNMLIDTGGDGFGTKTIGVSEDSLLYPVFEKEFMIPLRKHFEQHLRLVFAMYCDCKQPFDIHHDAFVHANTKLPGKPWISCLIPLSVDEDVDKVGLASTVIFNETRCDNPKEKNCDHLYEEKFSHVTRDKLKSVTVQKEYRWKRSSLVWWYSPLCHTSTHFKNFSSKQMLVCHTYIV